MSYPPQGVVAGDMTKAVYDPDKDGKIALAQLEDAVCSETEADNKITAHAGLPNAHHTEVHGADKHTDVTRELFIPALNDSQANAVLFSESKYSCIKLPDAIDSMAYFTFKVPDDFVSFTSLKVVWMSPAAAGDMYHYLFAKWAAATEERETHTESWGDESATTGGTNKINATVTNLVFTNLALGDYVGLEIQRDGISGLDSLDADVYLYGILFTYTGEQ